MKLILSHDFPHSPPEGYFLTKIFHPNIASHGEICVNALKKDWIPSLGLRHVLIVIRCLLIEPFPESALNEQADKMLLENYDEYDRHAKLYTGVHALKSKPKLKTGAISESTTTTLNVNQTNTSERCSVDQKSAGAAQLSSPLAPKPKNGQDYPATTPSPGVGGSTATSAALKKEARLSKVPVDKNKIDARKKSLKRL